MWVDIKHVSCWSVMFGRKRCIIPVILTQRNQVVTHSGIYTINGIIHDIKVFNGSVYVHSDAWYETTWIKWRVSMSEGVDINPSPEIIDVQTSRFNAIIITRDVHMHGYFVKVLKFKSSYIIRSNHKYVLSENLLFQINPKKSITVFKLRKKYAKMKSVINTAPTFNFRDLSSFDVKFEWE